MRTLWEAIKESITDLCCLVAYTVKSNIYILGTLIELSAPYIMWSVVINEYERRGCFTVGGEIFIPLVLFFFSSVMKRVANKGGYGNDVPVAKKRFTQEEEYGEITIREEDVQEVILYLNDVENYIEKKGLQKWES